jgi:hypothetical protein
MKRNKDDVYFFTIIDFLIQVIFFGVFVFVAYQTSLKAKEGQSKVETNTVLSAAGVSSLTEITDFFSTMGPISDFKGIAEFFSPSEKAKSLQDLKEALRQAGSTASLKDMVEKQVRKEGQGLPPCLSDVQGGRTVVRSLASLVSYDTHIEFKETTPDLQVLLNRIDLEYSAIRVLPFEAFRKAFSRVIKHQPDCRYTVNVLERTRFVDGRDAISTAFYLRLNPMK